MRRDMKILLGTIALGGGVAAADRLPAAVSEMETFRVTDVTVHGEHFLSRDEVMDAMAMPARASVWGDLNGWTESLLDHPLIVQASVERRVPNGLDVVVTERVPVAFVATPTIEPVDRDGVRLILDPTKHRLDLPVVWVDRAPAAGARLMPADARLILHEVARLSDSYAAFLQRVSEIRPGPRGSLVARWADPAVDFLLPAGISAVRLQEGESALAHALRRSSSTQPVEVDLRFADQVVVRFAPVPTRLPVSATGS